MEWSEMREMYRSGVSIKQIADQAGCDRKTVSRYVNANEPPKYCREPRGSLLDPYKNDILAMLDKNPLTAPRVLREIRKKGYTGGLTLVKRFISPVKETARCIAEIRFETEPGQQAQADWADLGWFQFENEEVHLYAFVMVLGWSRMRFVCVTDNLRTDTFIGCHLLAFEYFGGWPKTILYDNTKNVVQKRTLKVTESTFNTMHQDFIRHYGITTRLCKPGLEGAKTKGKVERAIQYVEKDLFMGIECHSIPHINALALDWCREANAKEHGTTHEVPCQRLPQEGLSPLLSVIPYPITYFEGRKAYRDCLVRYQNNFYSLPHRFAGRECQLVAREGLLEISVAGEAVARHEIAPGAFHRVINKEHLKGLYGYKRNENANRHAKRLAKQKKAAGGLAAQPELEVERRDLAIYDAYMGDAS